MEEVTFPGAHAPDRRRTVLLGDLALAVHEWGPADAPPLLFAHGGFDFARTLDVFAPKLVAGGWRVVSWDQRGHGDSDHALLYNWDSDVRDALAVLDATTQQPIPFVGHSKGGSVLMQLADAMPQRCTALVNLDGLPSRRNWPDVADHDRARLLTSEVHGWLEHRRRTATRVRRAGTLEELAARRGRMNSRLTEAWLRYLVTVGGRHDDDGWRWKIDPVLRPGGFGPWRPEWSMMRMPGLAMPVLGILGAQPETMGWGTRPEDVEPWLPANGRVVLLEDLGHFVHIEDPDRVADLVLDFVGAPPPAPAEGWGARTIEARPAPLRLPPEPIDPERTTLLAHGRAQLALHRLRYALEPDARPLLLLHGLGERTPASAPAFAADWPGAVYGLDFTGHGQSTIPPAGGYTAEVLLADADTAVAHLGPVTVVGRGLGAYAALLIAGARADLVHGAVLVDGPGIIARSTGPGSPVPVYPDSHAWAPPDPFAVAELSRDIRSPDYAATFVRMALEGSSLAAPIAVCAVNRPEWLRAAVDEAGAPECTIEEALVRFR